MKRLIVCLSLLVMTFAAWALPTVTEVQTEVGKGNYAQAESMMREVVAAKPNSAKGHYLYAEILAHNARFAEAAQEAAQAKRIDPAIKFTQPEKFRSFEQLLERQQQRARAAATAPPVTSPSLTPPSVTAEPSVAPARQAPAAAERASGGLPGWIWPVGLLAVAFIGWKMFSQRRAAATAGYAGAGMPGGNAMAGAPAGYGGQTMGQPGMGQPGGFGYGAGRGPGGGLMGVGLAAAGGVAAGMLAEKMLHGGQDGHAAGGAAGSGLDQGSFADPQPIDDAASGLQDRSIDFGNGGDWGGDAGGGGSSDGGSSSSDGDGW